MKHLHFFAAVSLVALAIVMCALPASAQRIVNVQQGIGTLEQAIHSDSLNRKTQPTVYVLERGGYYGTLTSIVNYDHVYIRAAYGTGLPPVVRPAKPATGSAVRSFAGKGNLTLRGLYVVNMDDNPTAPALITVSVRPTAGGLRIVIDSCHFDQDGGASIRLDNKNNKVFITNSIFSNLGDMNNANGRILDTRGQDQDTVVIENCIIYNVTEKLLRTGTAGTGGNMGYQRINQNTIVNCPDNTMWNFGKVKEGIYTNNLMVNSACNGDTSTVSGWITADPRSDVAQTLTIANNNWYIDTAITNMYPTIKPPFALFTPRRRNMTDTTATRISTGLRSKNDTVAVAFVTGLPVPKATVLSMHDTSKTQTNNQKTNLPAAPGSIEFDRAHYAMNLTYATTSKPYTWGTMGQRIGSWLDWKIAMGVGDHGSSYAIPTSYSLDQNYPNPFNPTTHISYSISKTAQVRVEVFDLLGQSVRLLESARQQPGNYTIVWDGRDRAGRLQSSGVYLYRLHVDDVPMTKKMILMK